LFTSETGMLRFLAKIFKEVKVKRTARNCRHVGEYQHIIIRLRDNTIEQNAYSRFIFL
jgi:hypothetical protein